MRRLTFAGAILASMACWAPLCLAGARGRWWLAGCLLTIPVSEACWRIHNRADERRDD
jgi:hypothetical protein